MTLDQKISKKNLDAYKRRAASGLHRVITYPNTDIKAKCKVVVIRDDHGSDINGTNVDIVPQTGQWFKMSRNDITDFLQKKTFEHIDGVLLDSPAPASAAAPSPQQSQSDHNIPEEYRVVAYERSSD